MTYLAITGKQSATLATKYTRLEILLTEFASLLTQESEIDRMPPGKLQREATEELDYQMKRVETSIGKVWNTLSGQQQIDLWNNCSPDIRYVFDGF